LFGLRQAVQLVHLNYCSLTHAASSWDFEHLEQLFGIMHQLNTTGDNNISVGCYAVTTVTTKNEQLFAASPVYQLTRRSKPNYCSLQTQLGFGSDFTIVRSRTQYLEQRVLTYFICPPSLVFFELLFAIISLTPGTTNKKTHANAWALLKFVWATMQSPFLLKHKR
jgi:hypothetical protein